MMGPVWVHFGAWICFAHVGGDPLGSFDPGKMVSAGPVAGTVALVVAQVAIGLAAGRKLEVASVTVADIVVAELVLAVCAVPPVSRHFASPSPS